MDTQKETRDRRTLLIEIGNAVTHGIGAGLSIAGLILLIIRAVHTGSPMRIVTFTIYGSALILFYLSSTLFHALIFTRAKRVFQILDHSMIFVLSVIGIVYKCIWLKHKSKYSTIIYILMGWLCLVAFMPLWRALGPVGFGLLLLGGLSFTLGALFYSRPTAYTHLIWHIFVLIGTILMYFSILLYV